MKIQILRAILYMSMCTVWAFMLSLFFTTILVAEKSSAQKIEKVIISVDLENATIPETFKEIESKTEFKFLYNRSVVDGSNSRVTLRYHSVTVEQVLTDISMQTGAKFRLLDNTIAADFPEENTTTMYQETIQGRVTDAQTGEALLGVNVVIVGTTIGTSTDSDGEYLLSISQPGTYQVSFTFIGYGPLVRDIEVTPNETLVLDAELTTRELILEDIVAIGYGTQTRRDVTGSVASIPSRRMQGQAVGDINRALQGQVAGLRITQSDRAPGAGTTVRIRGDRSLTASNSPLFVVDGTPMSGIQDIDLGNIESVEVLKDASATAIYGSRGANGVILITTKRGFSGGTLIQYENYFGIQQEMNRQPMMNTDRFVEMMVQAHRRNTGEQDVDISDFLTPNVYQGVQNGVNEDWVGLVLRDAMMQNHRLSISGGDEKTRFSISPSIFQQDGIVIDQGYKRFNLNASLDHDFNEYFKMGVSALLSRSQREPGSGGISRAARMPPSASPYDSEGFMIFNPAQDNSVTSPLSQVANSVQEQTRSRILLNVYAETVPLPWLSYRVSFSPDLLDQEEGQFRGAETSTGQGEFSSAWSDTREDFSYVFDNVVNADHTVADIHRLRATLLYSIERSRTTRSNIAANRLPFDSQLWHNLGSADEITEVGSSLSEWTLQSYMGRFNYGLKDRYLFTLTGRIDGSSRLAEGNQYGFFPSGAFAWIASDESFMQPMSEIIRELKLRISYGQTGNTAISPYQTQGRLAGTAYNFDNTGVTGFYPNEIPSPDLNWEKTTTLNLGLDLSILSDRFRTSIDVYQSNTTDLILSRNLPISIGFGSFLENIGETKGVGIEIQQSGNLVRTDKFNWNVDLNFNAYTNEIVSLYGDDEDDVGSSWFIGERINVHFDHKMIGIWQTDEAEEAALHNRQPGDMKIEDIDSDFSVSADDRQILGSPDPTWSGAISSSMNYRNFDFSFMVMTEQGTMIYSDFVESVVTRLGENLRHNMADVNFWTPDNPSNTIPSPNSQQISNKNILQYIDASYVRVQNITLGFRIPRDVAQNLGMQMARIYLTAQNPFLLTSDSYIGHDPDGGNSISRTPSYRSFLGGIQLNF